VAESRGDHRRVAKAADLTAVGVAREGEGHARGNARKDVGLVSQEDHGRIVADLGKGAVEIIDAGELAPSPLALAPEQRQLIPEAGHPEAATVLDEPGDVVFVNGNADLLQGAAAEHGAAAGALGGAIVPPVVIAENRVHAERRPESAERLGPLLWRDGARP